MPQLLTRSGWTALYCALSLIACTVNDIPPTILNDATVDALPIPPSPAGQSCGCPGTGTGPQISIPINPVFAVPSDAGDAGQDAGIQLASFDMPTGVFVQYNMNGMWSFQFVCNDQPSSCEYFFCFGLDAIGGAALATRDYQGFTPYSGFSYLSDAGTMSAQVPLYTDSGGPTTTYNISPPCMTVTVTMPSSTTGTHVVWGINFIPVTGTQVIPSVTLNGNLSPTIFNFLQDNVLTTGTANPTAFITPPP